MAKQNHSNYFIYQSVIIIFILFYLTKATATSSKLNEFSPSLSALARVSLLLITEKVTIWKRKWSINRLLNFNLNLKQKSLLLMMKVVKIIT